MPALTPREQDVVRLVCLGYSNKQIAQELGIKVTTVKWNMTNILAKFEVQSSKQLIAYLSQRGTNDLRDWKLIQ
jgi:DNA-binding CsgD family transcriptional regulator